MKWFSQHTVWSMSSQLLLSLPLFSSAASAPTTIIRLNRSLLSALLKTRTMPNKRRSKVNYLLEINFSNRLVQEWRSFYTRLIWNERTKTEAREFMDFKGKRKRTLNHLCATIVRMKMVLINDRQMIYNNDSLTNGWLYMCCVRAKVLKLQ